MHFQLPSGGKVVAALVAAGLAAAAVVAFRMPDRSISEAVMQFHGRDPHGMLDRLNQAQQQVLSRTSLTQIVMHEDIYRQERSKQPLEEIIQDMRNKWISMRKVSPAVGEPDNSLTISVAFQYPDRRKAQAVTRDLVTAFEAKSAGGNSSVLDDASFPASPIYPNRAVILGAGLITGLALGFILIAVRRWGNILQRRG